MLLFVVAVSNCCFVLISIKLRGRLKLLPVEHVGVLFTIETTEPACLNQPVKLNSSNQPKFPKFNSIAAYSPLLFLVTADGWPLAGHCIQIEIGDDRSNAVERYSVFLFRIVWQNTKIVTKCQKMFRLVDGVAASLSPPPAMESTSYCYCRHFHPNNVTTPGVRVK